ncbi:MAG: hypothetical protein ABIW76_08400 [Fibrobacteria bacterium]
MKLPLPQEVSDISGDTGMCIIDAILMGERNPGALARLDLYARGICALRPGLQGMSENVEGLSVLGRILEHSRIHRFANGGEPLHFIGSVVWMT